MKRDIKYNIKEGNLPSLREPAAVYGYVLRSSDQTLLNALLNLIGLSDEIISNWLNITARTFRNYKTKNTKMKENTKEHIVSILSLYNHGLEVFESRDQFERWLISANPLLDHKAPSDFLDTITGIQFIDDRLTAMEFGENV